jgi:hypothetical protein
MRGSHIMPQFWYVPPVTGRAFCSSIGQRIAANIAKLPDLLRKL